MALSEDSKRLENPPCHLLAMLAHGLNCVLLAALLVLLLPVTGMQKLFLPHLLAIGNVFTFQYMSTYAGPDVMSDSTCVSGLVMGFRSKYLRCRLLLWVKSEFV